MWRPEPDKERIIFQTTGGSAVSIYGTDYLRRPGYTTQSLKSIDLSSYETIVLARSFLHDGVAKECSFIGGIQGRVLYP